MHVRQKNVIQYKRGPRASFGVKLLFVQTILYTVTIRRHESSTRTPSSLYKDSQVFPKLRLAPVLRFMNQHVQYTPNSSLKAQHLRPHLFSPPPSNIHRSSCKLATFLLALLFNAPLISSSTATGSQCAFSLLNNSIIWFSCSVRHRQHSSLTIPSVMAMDICVPISSSASLICARCLYMLLGAFTLYSPFSSRSTSSSSMVCGKSVAVSGRTTDGAAGRRVLAWKRARREGGGRVARFEGSIVNA
jgi:hypothetical protein